LPPLSRQGFCGRANTDPQPRTASQKGPLRQDALGRAGSLLGSYQQSKLKPANLSNVLKETRKLLNYDKNFSTMRSKSPGEGSRETARRARCDFGARPAKHPHFLQFFYPGADQKSDAAGSHQPGTATVIHVGRFTRLK
jgi:hypothetical protein